MTERTVPPPLSPRDLAGPLASLPAWRLVDGRLVGVYRAQGFRASMLIANAIAHLSEVAWHHPELRVSWDRVEIVLWTHEVGAVTARDVALAERIHALLDWRPEPPLEGTPVSGRWAYLRRE